MCKGHGKSNCCVPYEECLEDFTANESFFGSVRSVSLNRCLIDCWEELTQLRDWPSLRELRIASCPLFRVSSVHMLWQILEWVQLLVIEIDWTRAAVFHDCPAAQHPSTERRKSNHWSRAWKSRTPFYSILRGQSHQAEEVWWVDQYPWKIKSACWCFTRAAESCQCLGPFLWTALAREESFRLFDAQRIQRWLSFIKMRVYVKRQLNLVWFRAYYFTNGNRDFEIAHLSLNRDAADGYDVFC